MKKILFLIVVNLSLINLIPSASAGSMCNNGSYSMNSGRGTCSWNGGVDKSFPSFSDPGSSSFNRNNGFGSGLGNSFGSTSRNDFSTQRIQPFGSGLTDPYGSIGRNSIGSSGGLGSGGLSSSKRCYSLRC